MRNKTILLVEDEIIQAMTGKMTLEKYGYAVVTVASGEAAVAAADAEPKPDLILMDIDLGSGIDGTQAAAIILSRHDIPVVFLSSHMEPEIVEKTEKITSYGYVVKNSSVTVLDASIKMAFKLFDAKLGERRKEQVLQETNRKYETLFNSMTEGFAVHEIICDEEGKPVDYRFLDMNPAFERLTGLKGTNLIGNTVRTAMPGTEQLWIDRYGQVALGGEVAMFENYSAELGRYYQVIAFSPEKRKFAVIFSDITERKLAEIRLQTKNEEYETLNEELRVQNEELITAGQTLRESEERFRALHNASFGGIAIHDRGIILECNQGLAEMSGYSVEELTGMDGLLLVAPESRDLVRHNIGIGYENPYEAFGIRKNGEVYPMRLEARNVPYKGKKARTVEFRDITERRNAENEINALLEEKELLLKEVHHRIKNNMHTINALLELQADSLKSETGAAMAIREAGWRVKSMQLLYDKLYRSTDLTALSTREYLPLLLEEIMRNFPGSESVRMDTEIEDIKLDAAQLQPLGIIVNELLTNTMKYAFSGKNGGVIRVAAIRRDSRIVVTVEDDGCGIPESTGFRSGGFGLMLVDELARQLGGTMSMERGAGTRIVLEFGT